MFEGQVSDCRSLLDAFGLKFFQLGAKSLIIGLKVEGAADLFLGSGQVSAGEQDIGTNREQRYLRVGGTLSGCGPNFFSLVEATGMGVDPREIQQSRLIACFELESPEQERFGSAEAAVLQVARSLEKGRLG